VLCPTFPGNLDVNKKDINKNEVPVGKKGLK
jgi:hypothetical protein